ncbi:CYTH domain-containing protein [Arcanobacterium pluranimalium]|uniref:adenylate cyclase n=1 Tax=Arcanobacterium pluranimalium TaxID=108028 RepID=UPI001959D66E|nr:adenylate cyclase [Arcanobacterium pluranimalium]MBM7824482.1 CYTH domain-containing protein [Arcanobacterium pluranimalium]
MSIPFSQADDRDFPFEFERKFFVDEIPVDALEHGSEQIIVQAYAFAEAGYAIRVRITFRGVEIEFPKFDDRTDHVGTYERRVLAALMKQDDIEAHAAATMGVKSPSVNGERYELETEIALDVAVQILQHSANLILKRRYSIWYGEDGWEFDCFAGQNQGLIVAECERLTPVVDLEIPKFCVTEVTGDPRFTNDSLSKEPWTQWDTIYRTELAARGPYFLNLRSEK